VRRVFWALVGIGAGAVIGVQVTRWANRTKQRYSPPNVARNAGSKIEDLAARFKDAIEEGLEEMTRAQAEIRAELGLPGSSSFDE
jgi:hypothetical protein